jgi:SAM-dependent methyltransferase
MLAAWSARVEADHEQVDRCREVEDPADYYRSVAGRFRADPRRTDDAVLNVLLEQAKADDVWLDVGAGAGRYALPIALHVHELIAVDPSPSMLSNLGEDAAANGIGNVRTIAARWPMGAEAPTSDVSLIAHVGYDIGQFGAFLDALETASRRLCVAVMGEGAMTIVATLFWQDIHGEPRVRLPAMPELIALLLARGRLPAVTWVDRVGPTFESAEAALGEARRQLWLREGSEKDQQLRRLARDRLIERDGRFSWDERPSEIGIASWSPPERSEVRNRRLGHIASSEHERG